MCSHNPLKLIPDVSVLVPRMYCDPLYLPHSVEFHAGIGVLHKAPKNIVPLFHQTASCIFEFVIGTLSSIVH